MTWLTLEQFLSLDKRCNKCDKPAKWLASGKDWPVYCDDHNPHIDTPNQYDVETKSKEIK